MKIEQFLNMNCFTKKFTDKEKPKVITKAE